MTVLSEIMPFARKVRAWRRLACGSLRRLTVSYPPSRDPIDRFHLSILMRFRLVVRSSQRHFGMCCSNPAFHRTHFDDEAKPDKSKKEIAHVSFWKPFSLRFRKDALERTYHLQVSPGWYRQDAASYGLSTVFLPVFVYTMWTEIHPWHIAIVSIISLFVGLQLWTFWRNRSYRDFEIVSIRDSACRALFVRYRFLSTVFVRLFVFFFITKVSSEIKLPHSSSFAVLLASIMKSPAVHMFLMSFHHRLEFRYHMPVQTAVLCLSLVWIQPFCQTCSSDPFISKEFQKVSSSSKRQISQ